MRAEPCASEVGLGYSQFLIDHGRSSILYTTDQIRATVAEMHRPKDAPIRVTYRPHSMYVPDPYLGYVSRPGYYEVTIARVSATSHADRHTFHVTVDKRGHRITSPPPARPAGNRPEIWIFGDSFVDGWGNDDETTLPFFLQRYLPGKLVVNYAENGYGNVHAYLQLQRDLPAANPPPAVAVVGYADFYNERNVAAWTRLQAFRFNATSKREAWNGAKPEEFTHPRARIRDGRLQIDYVPLFQAADRSVAVEPDPPFSEQYAVTIRLLTGMHRMLEAVGARMVIGFLGGPDDDPVVTAARKAGWTIADLRPDPGRHEWDDFKPLDRHPGPLAQSIYAWKLYRALSAPSDRRDVPVAGVP